MAGFLFSLVLFGLGFYVLVKGANILVRGGASLARIFEMSPWFIGMVILGIGTSIPEFAITIASVFEGNNLGVATVFGSTTFSILGIIGIMAYFMPLQFRNEWVNRDLPLFLLSTLVTIAAFYTSIFDRDPLNQISRPEGTILVLMLIGWVYYMLHRPGETEDDVDPQVFTWATSLFFIVAGGVGVFLGGKWVVDGASAFALYAGVSPELIGFTVLSIGTSLPEIAISFAAIRSRYVSLAIGMIIGSSIFDYFGIFGTTALLAPIPATMSLQFDMTVAFAATLLLYIYVLVGAQKRTISQLEGMFFVSLYVVYLMLLFIRG